jgi:hypothetical protein
MRIASGRSDSGARDGACQAQPGGISACGREIMPPMRRLTWLLIVASAICAMPLCAGSLRLAAPRAGEVLHGGGFATIQWSADALPPHAEEWEAFLSIDGGKYYAFRITPHLDLGIRRFDFVVPNVDTRNVRILIRTGDEKRETLFELPEKFSIVRDARAEMQVPHVNGGRAEAAREGDPVVLTWADGARDGSGVTQQTPIPVPRRSVSSKIQSTVDASPVLAPAGDCVIAPPIQTVAQPARVAHVRKAAPGPIAADLLLVCSRWNI